MAVARNEHDVEGRTENVRDHMGNITAVTGADGTKVECTYTQQNQVSSISTMDRTVVAMEYDSSGNLSSVEDGEGNTITKI